MHRVWMIIQRVNLCCYTNLTVYWLLRLVWSQKLISVPLKGKEKIDAFCVTDHLYFGRLSGNASYNLVCLHVWICHLEIWFTCFSNCVSFPVKIRCTRAIHYEHTNPFRTVCSSCNCTVPSTLAGLVTCYTLLAHYLLSFFFFFFVKLTPCYANLLTAESPRSIWHLQCRSHIPANG